MEERFERSYRRESVAGAKVESQMNYEQVSTGWWLVMKRLGLALWIGDEKPAIQTGDLLSVSIKKRD